MLVVTPNLCFDRTLHVDAFEAGTVSRPSSVEVTAGGKGVNVARTLQDLGHTAQLIRFVGESGGEALRALVADERLDLDAVPIAGAVRSATIVIEKSGRATVLNEPGPTVGTRDLAVLIRRVERRLDSHRAQGATARMMVCSGSLPPGLPADTFGRLTDVAAKSGALAVVDSAREVLAQTLAYRPDLVTPNLEEVEGLSTGRVTEASTQGTGQAETVARCTAAAGVLLDRGAQRAVVTAGSHGALFADALGSVWLPTPAVVVANPIGAGDSFVGGLAFKLAEQLTARLALTRDSWVAAARHGVCVAGAAVERTRAGRVDPRRAAALHDEVLVGL